MPFCLDLTDVDNIKKLVTETVEKFGTIDILINNAGVFHQKPFCELTADEWDKVMDINLRAHVLLSQEVLNVMKTMRRGYIINICSSIVFGRKHADRAAYSISKHAIVGLSKVLYDAGREFGIKVSTIYPDRTDTKMGGDSLFKRTGEMDDTGGYQRLYTFSASDKQQFYSKGFMHRVILMRAASRQDLYSAADFGRKITYSFIIVVF